MKPTLFDVMPANDRTRILGTEKELYDAFDICRGQVGLDLVIRDRRRVFVKGLPKHKVWYIFSDGSQTQGLED